MYVLCADSQAHKACCGAQPMHTSMITEARPVQFSAPLPDAVDVVVIGAGVA